MMKSFFLSFFFILALRFPVLSQSAVCDGNLGENIFTKGNFGTGFDNIVALDPLIAPGYRYDRTAPPNDGEYVLTNNTTNWGGIFPSWLRIKDNSSDPNGYMMVVNADYTPGLFYDQTVDNLCENTLYEFTADIINMIQRNVTGHIRPNVSFLIDGTEVFTTGEIAQDERWHTYGFTFTTDPGQTQVKLSLRNNAPGGIGNDLALDNITFRPCGPEALILPDNIANICEDGNPIDLDATVNGEQYDTPAFQWQQSFDEGITWVDIPNSNTSVYTHSQLSSGYYYYRYLLANGNVNIKNPKCRVNSNSKIVYVVPKFYTIIDTLCQGLSYQLNGREYSATGVYVDSLTSSIGCDSIVTLNLTIVPDAGINATVRAVDLSCHDSGDGQVIVESVANGAPPLAYSLSGRQETSPPFLQLPGGEYELSIADRYGCRFREVVSIGVPPVFTVDIGPDRTVNLGDLVRLQVNANLPVDTFYWQPADAFECPAGCATPVWYPVESSILRLEAVSDKGCQAADSIAIAVENVRRVYFPNAFSPNDDGVNDQFTIYGQTPNVQVIKRLLVFDRWGNVLFDRQDFPPNDEAAGWDGTSRGKPLSEGVYLYAADILFLDGRTLTFSGDVTLLR